jgi:L-alanine-DL-glutamate epimerase-like enolase superfamily enzyme
MATVRIRELRFDVLTIPFKVAFRHASAERAETSSVWVEAVSDGDRAGHGESCPRPYVTGETIESAREFFARHEASLRERVVDLASLRAWVDDERQDVDRNPAAWCAIELAILDLLARESGVTVEALLALPPLAGRFHYSAVLGDMGREAFDATAAQYRKQGFTDFKIKVSGRLDRDRDKVARLRQWDGIRVRVDANNLWRTADEAVACLSALDYPLFAVEEPIGARSALRDAGPPVTGDGISGAEPVTGPGEYDELAQIATRLGCKIVLDESFLRVSQIDRLAGHPHLWLINLRVSKMGGLLRSLAVVEAARAAHVGLIVGAQVGETSLLTRAALAVANAGRDILVAQEGAFGTLLLERDVCDPPLMFGPGGVLDVAAHPALAQPGFGVACLRL